MLNQKSERNVPIFDLSHKRASRMETNTIAGRYQAYTTRELCRLHVRCGQEHKLKKVALAPENRIIKLVRGIKK